MLLLSICSRKVTAHGSHCSRLAYIAGFLDGDGSIFFQLIRKHDYRFGFQIRPSVAFYQKTNNERILLWLKEMLVSGSIRRRRTGISDYTIVEACQVRRILRELQPYIRLKQEQVQLGLEILHGLPTALDPRRFLMLCRSVDRFRDLNYSKKRTITPIPSWTADVAAKRGGRAVVHAAGCRMDFGSFADSMKKQGYDQVAERI